MGMRSYCASASVLAMLATASPAWAQNQDAGSGVGLEDIIVTAQRKEESLQKVPVAVTALSSELLDNARITNVESLSGFAPNVQLTTQGVQSIPIIQIRGLLSGTSDNGVDPKIGIYLDGVYIGRSVGSVFDLADLERVEILRGPQGTLFGRNSTGGAISLVSAAPTGEFGIKQQVSYGNFDAFRARTILNLPAMGPLSLKLSYLHDEMGGYSKNLLAGKTLDFSLREPDFGTLTYARELGAKNVDAVQVAARLDIAPEFKVDYHFDYTDSKTTAGPMQFLGTTPDAVGQLAGAIIAFQPMTGGITNAGRSLLPEVAAATSVQPLTVEGHNLTFQWDVADELTVKSITAYRKMKQKPNIHDLGATGGLRFSVAQLGALLTGDGAGVLDPANQPGPNDSLFTLLTARSTSQKQFTQELQFIFDWDSVDLTSGLFYFHENSPATNVLGIFQPVMNGVVLPTPLDDAFGSGVTRTRAINDSMAAYGQATWHATDQLDLTLGARYTIDDRETMLISAAGAGGSGLIPGRVYKTSYSKFNYTGIVSWRPNQDVTTYAKIASGYVAGGILGAIPYEPENLTSYEVGLKSQWFDNRLRANIAAFYSDYKDLQTASFVGGVQRFDNAGKARIWGIEGEFQAAPFDGFTLDASFGYTNFKYKEYLVYDEVNDQFNDVADIARVTYTPKWNARLAGNYEFAELPNGGNVFVSAEARYRSRTPLTEFPSGSPALDALATAKAFTLVDARAGIAALPLANTAIDISVWGKNLFNERFATFGPVAINQVIAPDRGRTYGIDFAFKF